MASRNQIVTAVPTALVGIAAGTSSDIQNLSSTPISVSNAVAAPAAGDRAFSCGPLEFLHPVPAAGESTWVWVTAPTDQAVIASVLPQAQYLLVFGWLDVALRPRVGEGRSCGAHSDGVADVVSGVPLAQRGTVVVAEAATVEHLLSRLVLVQTARAGGGKVTTC